MERRILGSLSQGYEGAFPVPGEGGGEVKTLKYDRVFSTLSPPSQPSPVEGEGA